MTWPLASHLNRFIAWDLGDPAFICWVMMWTGGQVLKLLHGDINALHDYWNGNIFSPERLTIAYSEHFTPQMLQALPIFAATGNMVLCYNLLFLSTIVLAGWGMYLLVRELTGRPLAAFVAGLAFAFAPYRISEGSHLQVLSSQWMPLVLYGFRRYFVTGRTRPLVGASAALDGAEPVVRVLPALLRAVRGRVLPVRDGGSTAVPQRARLDVAHDRRDRGGGDHVAVRLAVHESAASRRRRRAVRAGERGVLGRRLRVRHGLDEERRGRARRGVSEGRGRRLRGLRDSRARGRGGDLGDEAGASRGADGRARRCRGARSRARSSASRSRSISSSRSC